MHLRKTETNEIVRAFIEPVIADDFKFIRKSRQFKFKWKEEAEKEIYKLSVKSPDEILGLMAVRKRSDCQSVEICLLESAVSCVGKSKKYDRVAGTLIAYACRLSVKSGYGGACFLTAKTRLIPHYEKKYGMSSLPNGNCYLEPPEARNLIREFWDN